MPSSRSAPRNAPDWLTGRPYAHRGLHGHGRPENSRAAFEAAIAAGHGIELDVQPSRDGVPMVFHDARLERLTDGQGPVAAQDAADLARVRLKDCAETMPTLDEILALVAGRTPLLIEVKSDAPGWRRMLDRTIHAVAASDGPAAVMGFHPLVPRACRLRAPAVARGLVAGERGARGPLRRLARWAGMMLARPDFVALDVRDLPSAFSDRCRRRGIPVLTWTVRGDVDRRRAARHADQIIFEEPE